MINTKRSRTALLVCVGVISVAACEESSGTAPVNNLHAEHAMAAMSATGAASAGLAAAVRAATARFHSPAQAEKAGYLADPHCVEVPALGGMGHHWTNPSLVDDVFEPTKPEAILYAPDKHGRMRLIAVEYIVKNTGQTAPTFSGQAFDVGGSPLQSPHWTLHVWLYEPNASGLFAPFNPDVDCP